MHRDTSLCSPAAGKKDCGRTDVSRFSAASFGTDHKEKTGTTKCRFFMMRRAFTQRCHREYAQSSSFGNEALTADDSSPVFAYVCSFSRVSTISSVRMVSWPIRSSGVNIDSPFSMVSRSGL